MHCSGRKLVSLLPSLNGVYNNKYRVTDLYMYKENRVKQYIIEREPRYEGGNNKQVILYERKTTLDLFYNCLTLFSLYEKPK